MRTVRRVVGCYSVSGMTILTYADVPLELDAEGRCMWCHDARIIEPPPELNKCPVLPCIWCRDED